MTKKFADLRKKMSPVAQARAEADTQRMLAALPLAQIRNARRLTQNKVAEVLGRDQGAISKIEREADMYLSTLRAFVEALGGELQLTARFPEGETHLIKLAEEEKPLATIHAR